MRGIAWCDDFPSCCDRCTRRLAKKVECNGLPITAGLCFVRHGVHPDFNKMVDYRDWDGEFVLGWGILLASVVRFDLSLDAEPVLALTAADRWSWAVPPTSTNSNVLLPMA
jgi:hypothetical protein